VQDKRETFELPISGPVVPFYADMLLDDQLGQLRENPKKWNKVNMMNKC
jgi:hypothetical protein